MKKLLSGLVLATGLMGVLSGCSDAHYSTVHQPTVHHVYHAPTVVHHVYHAPVVVHHVYHAPAVVHHVVHVVHH